MASIPLTGPDVVTDPGIEAAGINAMPSSLGDVFSGALETNPTTELANASARDMAISGYGIEGAPVASAAMLPGAEANVDAATLNDKYSIPARADGSGGLSFTNPLPDSVASSMYDDKRAELMRESVGARRPAGLLNSAAGLGTQFAAGALDPLNLAASFLPVVGEARYAEWLADAGSAIGRTAIRAGVGAAQGAVGTLPIAALQYGLSREQGGDMTAGDALLNVAFGSALGGGLHTLGGMVADALHGPFKSNPARVASGADAASTAISDAPLSIREAALRTSISQLVSGRPTEVTPFFGNTGTPADIAEPQFSGNELGGRTRSLADIDSETQAQLAEPAQNPGLQSDLEVLRGNQAQPAPAQSFMGVIRSLGPVKDENGELASLGIDSHSNPGLVSATGRPLDDLTGSLWEQGWFPEHGTERPMISDLLSAIYSDQHGAPRLHPGDLDAVAERQRLGALDDQLHQNGIDLRGNSNRDVERAMAGEPMAGPATLADLDTQDAAFNQVAHERFQTAAKLASGETLLPDDKIATAQADAVAKAPPVSEAPDPRDVANVRASLADSGRFMLPDEVREIPAIDAAPERAAARAKGLQQAATCLARGGM